MPNIYLDLETVGTDDPEVMAEITASIKPPKTLKKAESIAKWEEEEKPALVEDAIKRTSFDATYGRIICAGLAVDDDPAVAFTDDEPGILNALFAKISALALVRHCTGTAEQSTTFIGHNITGFDLRFLWQRAVINGIKPPSCIPFQAKPWDKTVFDTMVMWNPDRDRRISLDKLCRAFGVPTPKNNMDGSQVWDYYKQEKIAEIAEYCKGDVEATRACYKRMVFA